MSHFKRFNLLLNYFQFYQAENWHNHSDYFDFKWGNQRLDINPQEVSIYGNNFFQQIWKCSLGAELCLANLSVFGVCDLWDQCLWSQNTSWHESTFLHRCIKFKVLAVALKPLMASAEGQTALPIPGSELNMLQTDPCNEWWVLI